LSCDVWSSFYVKSSVEDDVFMMCRVDGVGDEDGGMDRRSILRLSTMIPNRRLLWMRHVRIVSRCL
jgi:hypothetical protein